MITVDLDPGISAGAKRHLQEAGVSNVSVVVGDGWRGIEGAPLFDRIEATVGVWDLSPAWVQQLDTDGILVAPLWLRAGLQASVALQEANGRLKTLSVEPCGFMRLRGPAAGQAGYSQIGPWTISFDEPDLERAALLKALLQAQPQSEPAPPLSPGWFTPLALRQPDAVHLFSLRSQGPVIYSGILDDSAPGLAVIASQLGSVDMFHTFGVEPPRGRLLDLIDAESPVEVRHLVIAAIPAGEQVDISSALTMLARPNFSFLVSAS